MRKKPRIVERKLGKELAWGQSIYWKHDKRRRPIIEVDPRLSPRRALEVFCHEALHIALPDHDSKKGEVAIDRIGKVVSAVLWEASYRRVYLSKHTTPVRITPKNKTKKK